jgi:hypothetical protein
MEMLVITIDSEDVKNKHFNTKILAKFWNAAGAKLDVDIRDF